MEALERKHHRLAFEVAHEQGVFQARKHLGTVAYALVAVSLALYRSWLWLVMAVLQTPKLVRQLGPGTRPQEREDFEKINHRYPVNGLW